MSSPSLAEPLPALGRCVRNGAVASSNRPFGYRGRDSVLRFRVVVSLIARWRFPQRSTAQETAARFRHPVVLGCRTEPNIPAAGGRRVRVASATASGSAGSAAPEDAHCARRQRCRNCYRGRYGLRTATILDQGVLSWLPLITAKAAARSPARTRTRPNSARARTPSGSPGGAAGASAPTSASADATGTSRAGESRGWSHERSLASTSRPSARPRRLPLLQRPRPPAPGLQDVRRARLGLASANAFKATSRGDQR